MKSGRSSRIGPPRMPARLSLRLIAGAVAAFLLAAPVYAADGWASEYGPGHGVAMHFCTWVLRHSQGCGWVKIQSLDTGITVQVPVIDWCECVVPDSGHPYRIVDLEYGVRDVLGLDPSRGLWQVSVERVGGGQISLPNTATR